MTNTNEIGQHENALATQVGGDHYKSMAIQPIEFALVNDLSTTQSKALKYVCRHHHKDGLKDLDKAHHVCELWLDIAEVYGLSWAGWDVGVREVLGVPFIRVETFIDVNGLAPLVAEIVRLICISPTPQRVRSAQALIVELKRGYAV